jgi:hypothetical protein
MKIFLITLLCLFAVLKANALDRVTAQQLLAEKNVSLTSLESNGSQLLLGEITGAGRVIPAKVEVIFINEEAILKKEIESMDQGLSSFRAKGVYFLNTDIKGVILKK